MTPPPAKPKPTTQQIAALKRLAAGIIRAQGNRFVKDLLRANQIRIGTNKDEFEANLNAAIENGDLTLKDVSAWLQGVEGWGNQHVYLYSLSAAMQKDLTTAKIQQRVKAAKLDSVWNGETTLAFPDKPALTSISFNDGVLRLIWQESSPAWTPEPGKNYQKQEGLDLYEYRAYRQVERRAITRFEARASEGIAGLFIPDPIEGAEHKTAKEEALNVIGQLMNRADLDQGLMQIGRVSRNFDQDNIPNNTGAPTRVKAQKSRLISGGSSIEFAADSPDKAYWEEAAVGNVRVSVKGPQLRAFPGGDGVFVLQAGYFDLARPLRIQLYGGDNRIRLWAQMDVSEVWSILKELSKHQ
jgi:hypothetical protein